MLCGGGGGRVEGAGFAESEWSWGLESLPFVSGCGCAWRHLSAITVATASCQTAFEAASTDAE